MTTIMQFCCTITKMVITTLVFISLKHEISTRQSETFKKQEKLSLKQKINILNIDKRCSFLSNAYRQILCILFVDIQLLYVESISHFYYILENTSSESNFLPNLNCD